jgi:peptidoglycan/LPS O-acetylase OafA/YrhL
MDTCDYEIHHIGVLDGIRSMAVLVVVWFHFWQQTWIMPSVGKVSLDWIPRTGYLLVDMMIFLSGFCLFLPYARKMVYGGETQPVSEFYVKRAARILPSYYLAVIISIVFAVVQGAYESSVQALKDIVPHLFLVHNFVPDAYIRTSLSGVLWTVAVEVQYYLFFPLYAKAFQKKPIPTYVGMTLIGVLSSFLICRNFDKITQGMYVNHVLTFACVYANGLLAAWFYVAVTKDKRRTKAGDFFWVIIACAGIYFYYLLANALLKSENGSYWQVANRYVLSVVFMLFVIAVMMSAKWFRKIFDNRVMFFLAGISYNLYLYHQFIAVKLKEYRIPYWAGDTPPNQTGDSVWQWKYQILCILVSALAAIATTYLVERPIAKKILAVYKRHRIE